MIHQTNQRQRFLCFLLCASCCVFRFVDAMRTDCVASTVELAQTYQVFGRRLESKMLGITNNV